MNIKMFQQPTQTPCPPPSPLLSSRASLNPQWVTVAKPTECTLSQAPLEYVSENAADREVGVGVGRGSAGAATHLANMH